MSVKYDDIIGLSRPRSKTRTPMARIDRAAQFAPFAALNGYAEAINETGRRVDKKAELSEFEADEINDRLNIALSDKGGGEVCVTYFLPDGKKAGGSYRSVKGVIKRVDNVGGRIVFTDGTEIPLDDVSAVRLKDEDGQF